MAGSNPEAGQGQRCSACRAENRAGARFCRACGASLGSVRTGLTSPVPPDQAALVEPPPAVNAESPAAGSVNLASPDLEPRRKVPVGLVALIVGVLLVAAAAVLVGLSAGGGQDDIAYNAPSSTTSTAATFRSSTSQPPPSSAPTTANTAATSLPGAVVAETATCDLLGQALDAAVTPGMRKGTTDWNVAFVRVWVRGNRPDPSLEDYVFEIAADYGNPGLPGQGPTPEMSQLVVVKARPPDEVNLYNVPGGMAAEAMELTVPAAQSDVAAGAQLLSTGGTCRPIETGADPGAVADAPPSAVPLPTRPVTGVVRNRCHDDVCKVYLRDSPNPDLAQSSDTYYLDGDVVELTCWTTGRRVDDADTGRTDDTWLLTNLDLYIAGLFVEYSGELARC